MLSANTSFASDTSASPTTPSAMVLLRQLDRVGADAQVALPKPSPYHSASLPLPPKRRYPGGRSVASCNKFGLERLRQKKPRLADASMFQHL